MMTSSVLSTAQVQVSAPVLTPDNLRWLQELANELRGPVMLWGRLKAANGQQEWFRCKVVPPSQAQWNYENGLIDVSLFLNHLEPTNEIEIRALDDGRQIVVCPIEVTETRFERIVAVAVCGLPTRQLLNRLITMSRRLVRQAELLDHQSATLESFAEQLSADFEEMTWMRQFADQLVVTGRQLGAFEGTESSLEGLRAIIQAEELVLVSAPRISREQESSLLFQSGSLNIDENSCLDLLELFMFDMNGDTLVKNRLQSQEVGGIKLESIVVTPIVRNKDHFGWLIAINKREIDPLTGEMYPLDLEVGRHEFGTSEASLMEAAASMLATHAHNVELFQQGESLMIGIIRSMINAVDAKDPYTCGHSERVAAFGRRIAEQMKLSSTECERIYLSGLLHDIGKIGTPDYILGKPDRLTDQEYDEIKKHPLRGYEILKPLKQFRKVLPGVLHHHEAVDGTGYPHSLKGDQIPLMARVLAVADAFDAMTSDRAYRKGMSIEKATSIMQEGKGTQWDAQVIEAFFDCLHDLIEIGITSMERTEELLHAEIDQSKPFVSNTLTGVLKDSADQIPVMEG